MVPKKSVPHFATQSRTVLSGSEKAPLAEAGGEKPAPLAARITVSVIVRRKTPLDLRRASFIMLPLKPSWPGMRGTMSVSPMISQVYRAVAIPRNPIPAIPHNMSP